MTEPTTLTATLWRDSRAILAESLWWDADVVPGGALRWCDITSGTLHTSPLEGAPDGSDDRVVRVPPPLASFAPVRRGGFVAGLDDRIVLLDEAGGIPRTVASVEHAHEGMRLNEGKCDPFGAFVVGSMDPSGSTGAIYRVTGDGRCTVLVEGVGTSNGFEWDDAGRFIWTDTSASAVYRADYRLGEDGTVELGESEQIFGGLASDGLTRDADGGWWNGIYGEGRVVRWTPGTDATTPDRVDTEIRVDAPNVTSVAFGGPDLRTLFIATARENLEESELEQAPASGGIFAIDLDAAGLPPHSFDDSLVIATPRA